MGGQLCESGAAAGWFRIGNAVSLRQAHTMTNLKKAMVGGMVLAVVLVPLATTADQSVARLRLRVWPAFAMAPADVRIDATVDPREENRALRITVDSGEFFRASTIALDGEKAPKYYNVQYRALPEGDFTVQLELIGQDGVQRALEHQEFHILP